MLPECPCLAWAGDECSNLPMPNHYVSVAFSCIEAYRTHLYISTVINYMSYIHFAIYLYIELPHPSEVLMTTSPVDEFLTTFNTTTAESLLDGFDASKFGLLFNIVAYRGHCFLLCL